MFKMSVVGLLAVAFVIEKRELFAAMWQKWERL